MCFLSACATTSKGTTATPQIPLTQLPPPSSTPPPAFVLKSSSTLAPAAIYAPPPTWAPTPFKSSIPRIIPTSPPVTGPFGYHLRDWSEVEALAAIAEGEAVEDKQRYEYDIATPSYSSLDFQEYLITLDREFLLRFPASQSRDEISWKLARLEANSWGLENDYPLAGFHSLLENTLNSGQVQPSALNTWISKRGFSVAVYQPAFNLFGDGQPAVVIQIESDPVFVKDAVFALTGERAGNYQLTPLRDQWLMYFPSSGGGEEIISIGDHNGNGQPEIISIVTAYGHAACYSTIAVYEWQAAVQGGQFVNIAQSVETQWGDYYHTNCSARWSFGPRQATGVEPIVASVNYINSADGCPEPEYKIIYDWSQSGYRQSTQELLPFEKLPVASCAIGWADATAALEEYDQAIPVLIKALNNWPAPTAWGPATKDYLRFKLGIWYAFQGQADSAQATLHSLQTTPADPRFAMAAQLAEIFLANYQVANDVYPACEAVNAQAAKAYAAIPYDPQKNFGRAREDLISLWGFSDPDWDNEPEAIGNICPIGPARRTSVLLAASEFRHLARTHMPTSKAELIDWLRQHQIAVWAVESGDLTEDGLIDWLAVIKVAPYSYWELWALISGPEGVTAVRITEHGIYSDSFFTTLYSFRPDASSPLVYVFTLGERLIVFRLDQQGSETTADTLLNGGCVQSYKVQMSVDRLELIIRHCDGIQSHVWDPQRQTFISGEYLSQSPRDQQRRDIQQIEAALFDSGDVSESLRELRQLLGSPIIERWGEGPPVTKPYLQYLLGLTYELTGDAHSAVSVYWHLWQKYPQNPYAYIARRKLEPITP
jgi:tetratricopeptide (TPR) repeat protein